jgi:hypothetical protein
LHLTFLFTPLSGKASALTKQDGNTRLLFASVPFTQIPLPDFLTKPDFLMIVPLLAGVVKYLVFKREGDASLRSASFGSFFVLSL